MIRFALLAFLVGLASGCAQMAPRYNPSVENIQVLRDSGAGKVRVGTFEAKLAEGQNNEAISLRGASMGSPYGGKYTTYIEEAIRSELGSARLLDDKANVEIGGVLMKNDVSVGNITTGYGEIEVRVIVRRGSQVRFDKVKYTKSTFETGFVGATAVGAGTRAYPDLVQKLIGMLFADPDFIAALR